jgi:hypothetical protein
MGWLTVVAYGIATLLCSREALRHREDWERALFWGGAALLMLLLGVNKQLDLQTWMTLVGRKTAMAGGWYEKRRAVQLVFIILLTVGAFALAGRLWRMVHQIGADLWLPALGVFLVVCFVIVRAASFHYVDRLLGVRLAGFKMNWLFELGAISVVVAGALRARTRGGRRGPIRLKT